MRFLIDTCVISELIKPAPNPNLLSWMDSRNEETLFLSAITIGEIQKGISTLPDSTKRKRLQDWLDRELMERFDKKIIAFDLKVAQKWGEIQAAAALTGKKMPVIDGMIASIGLVHEMTVVTRNMDDMLASGVSLHNPWDEQTVSRCF